MTPADLIERRRILGLSLTALAEALGVDRSTIYRWEHQRRRVPGWLPTALRQVEAEHPKKEPS